MNKPLAITTPGGEDLVILPRAEYDDLVARAGRTGRRNPSATIDDREDAALSELARTARARVADGRSIRLPLDVSMAIADGTGALKAIRHWRGLTQAELAARSGTDQGMISALEAGRRRGSSPVWRSIAAALDVPMETIVPEQAAAGGG
ncbi:MAG: helix-turn-helix transcriptional regulator [Bauldia sp.]|nr:helix-turn-helix transcriptional regulator [Bauldia sp.]